MLEMPSEVEAGQDAAKTQADLDLIRQATLADDLDTLLEETRRLTDAEADRRKTAESKATIYLTVVGVLAPILASITPTVFDDKGGLAHPLITFAIFVVAGLYLLRSGLWAFRTLQVSASARLDTIELVALWGQPDRKATLVKGLLGCVRRNRAGVNAKVTSIKMAHELGLRAFSMFVLALLVRAGWEPAAALIKALF
jgi:hypothetical protein